MDHPFEAGKEYRNRNGSYVVLAIEEPKMAIRYEDGHEALVTIATQARIWQAMKDEELRPKPPAVKITGGRKKRRKPARQGYAFSGLQESDFKNNVTGTHWRSRDSLGGRLAQHLSESTPYDFQSHAIYRRPSVYVYLPDYYDPSNGVPYAKFELRLSPEGALYSFYVERADQTRTMDSTWHWRPFLNALETDEQLQGQLLQAMRDHNLFWLLQLEGDGANFAFEEEIRVQAGSPLLWNGTEEIDWSEFTNRLRAIPSEQWLNVHLCASMDKEDGIDAGRQFSAEVTQVFRALLPLYLTSTRVN